MADPREPAEVVQVLLREDLMHEAHPALRLHLALVDGDARALLAPMLEDPQSVVHVGGDRRGAGTPDNPALLARPEVVEFGDGPVRHPQRLFAQA